MISMAARANLTVDQYVIAKIGKTLTQLVNNYPFNDTNNSYVVAAEAIGIVSGRAEKTFDPYSSITRQEVAVILTAMSRVTGDSTGNPPVANVIDRSSIASGHFLLWIMWFLQILWARWVKMTSHPLETAQERKLSPLCITITQAFCKFCRLNFYQC